VLESILNVGTVSETESPGVILPREIKSAPQVSQYSAPAGFFS
jgi:hypothetical protein